VEESALVVECLHKRYGRVEALRGLTFSVPGGAFFGLFGRNGAGKTTTLDVVTGLLARDSGRVRLLGEELRVEPEPATKARFGYVAGHLQLYDWMTCREHIDFLARFYSTWDKDREEQLLRMFHLPLHQRVKTLSRGQHVQLQLLMALSHHPELLLVDEPGNLDAVVRQRLTETLIEAIAEERTTVVMASHILSELDGVCDHLCIIDKGVALTAGPVESLVDSVRRVHYQGVKSAPPEALRVDGGFRLERRGDEVRVVLPGYTPERTEELADQLGASGYET
jgi:ABC-2 type transport system ATP-binding protein